MPAADDAVVRDDVCPKCGSEMEPIEITEQGPPFQQLHLCPACYLVMWRDPEGIHIRQGVPVRTESMTAEPDQSISPATFLAADPKKC